MKKVVISGATSMVGIALIEECIKNDVQVLALVREKSINVNRVPVSKCVKVVECDLTTLKTYIPDEKGYDVFYHFGWSNTNKEGRKNVDKQMENISFALDALSLAKKMGCKKFVGAGSQAEYGIHSEKRTRPDSRLEPKDAYGVCKAAAGKLCSIEAANIGMDFAWVRIFSLYGKYELPETLIQTTLPKMLKGERCFFTEGIQQWDYLYSSDAGEAFFKLGEKLAGNKFYCLGSGESHPLRYYIQVMKETVESTSELLFGAIPYESNNTSGMCADISELKKDIGWEPRIIFSEGIRKEMERLQTLQCNAANEKN